jgi:Spy/CpxP family protein refolding chaperone
MALILIFSLSACNQSDPLSTQETENTKGIGENDADFLLVAHSDPLELEESEAFKIDGIGPMYFWVLDLSEEQKEQIKAIVSDLRPDFKEIYSRWINGKSWEEIRDERKALREQIRQAIYEILSDEQKAIVDEMTAQLEAGEFPDAVVEKRVEVLTEKLDLSEDQQQQVTDLLKEYGSQMIQMRNSSDNPIVFHIAKFQLFLELNAKFKEILTEEQIALYYTFKTENIKKRFPFRFPGWSDKK